MASQCLALYLDAPLQSWGYQSRFDRRTSLSFPTRSGVFGLLCAAAGIDRSDEEGLERLESIGMTVLCFGEASLMHDFHTVGGGYDKKTHPRNITQSAEGKTGNTVVTRREYIQDARFGVLLHGEQLLLLELAGSLQNPRWGIWLGRKSCIPASPLFQGIFGHQKEAISHLEHLAGGKPSKIVREVEDFNDGTDTLMDRPLHFLQRNFSPRRISVSPPEEDNSDEG